MGWLRDGPILLRFQGGVAARSNKCCEASLAAQTGWLVKCRVAHLILLESTNHPVCAAKERDLLLRRSHPSLRKRRGMEPSRNQPIPLRRNLSDSSVSGYKLSRKLRGLALPWYTLQKSMKKLLI